MPAIVGTSGWQYQDWRGDFYPHGLPTSRWLAAYAARFPMVEVNNTFYRLPAPGVFERWAAETAPTGLRFVVKVSRYLTHVRRLADPAEPVARLMDRAAPLGSRLDAVLLQLPPTMPVAVDRLDATLRAFGSRRVRVVVEPRHPSWLSTEVCDLLRAHNACLCWADRRSRTVGPLIRTADWAYVRMHQGRGRDGSYGRTALATWAERLARLGRDREDVYVAFNNDHAACAPRNASTLVDLLRVRGMTVVQPEAC